jgi:hypothetical protein
MLSEEAVRIMREKKQVEREVLIGELEYMQTSGYSSWKINNQERDIAVIKGEINQLDIVLEEK